MNAPATRDAFGPLLVLTLALLLWFGFQAIALVDERGRVQVLQERQTPLLENSKKLRDALDSLVVETHKLATAGNPRAKAVVDELGKRGFDVERVVREHAAEGAK